MSRPLGVSRWDTLRVSHQSSPGTGSCSFITPTRPASPSPSKLFAPPRQFELRNHRIRITAGGIARTTLFLCTHLKGPAHLPGLPFLRTPVLLGRCLLLDP
ncbi:hypothetical protein BDW71DRAFT_175362 [Aspergillus fruticulosus]